MAPRPPWQSDLSRAPTSVDDIVGALARLGEPGHDPVFELHEPPKLSALLVPVVDLDGEAAVIVTKRPATMQHHANDWVFPGGRFHEDDGRTSVTAVREAEEELGFPRRRTDIIGRLTTRGPIITGYVIDVFVGLVQLADLSPDPREVAEVAILPLSKLMAADAYREGGALPDHVTGQVSRGAAITPLSGNRPLHFFQVRQGEDLWGAQGDILFELLTSVSSAPV